MTTNRTWYSGTVPTRLERLEPGDIVGHEYQPWIVIDVRLADDGLPVVQLEREGRRNLHLHARQKWATLPRMKDPEHFPVCACGDLTPCRELDLRDTMEREIRTLDLYTTPGICPACGEVVTSRQQSMSWPNIMIPGTPDVRFHLRQSCHEQARRYDERCAEAGHPSRFASGTESLV